MNALHHVNPVTVNDTGRRVSGDSVARGRRGMMPKFEPEHSHPPGHMIVRAENRSGDRDRDDNEQEERCDAVGAHVGQNTLEGISTYNYR